MKKNLSVAFLLFAFVFVSCDQEFNTIGADLIGNEHFNFEEYEVQGLKAYSVKTDEVQTNNLPINPLGVYDNYFFGKTNANFVSQVSVPVVSPKFGTNVQIENVTLYVPYFSTAGATNSDGSREYKLDSIYTKDNSSEESKIKLDVYENGFELNSFGGVNQSEAAKYYSNMDPIINAQKRGHDGSGNSVIGGTRLNDSSNPAENDQFFFSNKEIKVFKTKFNTVTNQLEYLDVNDVVTTDPAKYAIKERLAPGIYLTLNKEYFKKKILETSASNLSSLENFKTHFKGLYFKTEEIAGQTGAMAMLNFANAKINLNYSSKDDGSAATAVATSKTFLINVTGNTVSLQNYAYPTAYDNGLTASQSLSGTHTNLYLKGGKGSVVYMDIFSNGDLLQADGVTAGANGIPDEIDKIKLKKSLINDAYLEFYVNQSVLNNTLNDKERKNNEPLRLYLFDATNQKPLADYVFDTSVFNENTKKSKYVHGGIIERDASGKGFKYKIRITQHINNLIYSSNENFNKNVKLGLAISETIAINGNVSYESPKTFSEIGSNISKLPTASVLSQQGTVLYGTDPANTDKKLKLIIHFTKPN